MDTPDSLAEHLDRWLELQRTQLQPSTLRQYTGTANRYLMTHLGDRRIEEITHRDISDFYRTLLFSGGLRGKPLALATVQRVAAMTHKVFEDAVRDDLITANPCDKALLPRIDPNAQPRELRIWTTEQLASFLEHQRRRRLWPLWVVAAGTGMRRGELLGLRWRDVDLEGGTVHVRRSLSLLGGVPQLKVPKSNRSRSLRIGEAVQQALQRQLPTRRWSRPDSATPACRPPSTSTPRSFRRWTPTPQHGSRPSSGRIHSTCRPPVSKERDGAMASG